MIHRLLIVAFSILFPSIILAQVSSNAEYDELNEEYKIIVTNDYYQSITIKMTFTVLNGYRASPSAPVIVSLTPRSSKVICKLSKQETMGTRRFKYRYDYSWGCLDQKVNNDVKLLLPVARNRSTEVKPLTSLTAEYGKEQVPPDWNAKLFTLSNSDTIFTVRRGRVVSVKQENGPDVALSKLTFKRARNEILIQHEDCTFGEYSVFKQNSSFVSVGDLVEAGQPLAIAAGGDYTSGFHVRYVQYYYDNFNYYRNEDEIGENKPKYMPLHIATNGGVPLVPGTYTNNFTDEDIMQEMNKRERKRWLKKHASEKQ
jgi:hypothetical protein